MHRKTAFTLEDLGWNDFFASQWTEEDSNSSAPARVAEEFRGHYRLLAAGGAWLGELAGRLRFDAASREDLPAVGDWVAAQHRAGSDRATIHRVLARRSKFSRQAAGTRGDEQIVACNVDTVLLVTSLNREFSPRRIERYLTMIWESRARPAIVLNKADLCAERGGFVNEAEAVALGVPIHVTSAATGEGVDALDAYLSRGQTVALLGSSGVGKSTLINRLLGTEQQATKPVREEDDRGRHATTSRQMMVLPRGGVLIDTPGMRELQLWESPGGLAQTFADVEALAAQCRFDDCSHAREPGCAVRAAVEDGRVEGARLESYHKLQRELHFQSTKHDKVERAKAEKRWRGIHKDMKRFYKSRDWK